MVGKAGLEPATPGLEDRWRKPIWPDAYKSFNDSRLPTARDNSKERHLAVR